MWRVCKHSLYGARWLLLLTSVLLGSPSAAVATPAWVSQSAETCPVPQMVWSALVSALTVEQLASLEAQPGTFGSVVDSGASFAVTMGRKKRVFQEPARACDERARMAAVFMALAILEGSTLPPAGPAAPIVSPSFANTLSFGITAMGAFDWGAHVGFSARAERKVAWWGFAGGISGVWPSSARRGDLSFNEGRLAADVALRFVGSLQGTRLALDVGPIVSAWRIEGEAPFLGRGSQVALTSGARLAVTGRWELGRFSPFFTLGAEGYPRPVSVTFTPGGQLDAPTIWLFTAVGFSIEAF